MAKFAFLAILGVVFLKSVTSSQCYYPDGSQDSVNQPCNLIQGTTSMCCSTNRTVPYGEGSSDINTPDSEKGRDMCLGNGLCQYGSVNEDGSEDVQYIRNSCTSQSWEGCLKVCGDSVSPT